MTSRLRCIVTSAIADGIALTAAYFVALAVRGNISFGPYLLHGTFVTDWSLGVMLAATAVSFAAVGLYTT